MGSFFTAVAICFWIICALIWIGILILIVKRFSFHKLVDAELTSTDRTVLLIKTHAQSDQKEDMFENFLTSLHAIIPHSIIISLEIASNKQFIHFYVTIPKAYASMVQSQLYTHFPDTEIEEVPDYIQKIDIPLAIATLKHKGDYPFKTYKDGLSDFLKSLSAMLSSTNEHEGAYIQLVLRFSGQKIWERNMHHWIKFLMQKDPKARSNTIHYEGLLRVAYASSVAAEKKLDALVNLFKQTKGEQGELKKELFSFLEQKEHMFKTRSFEYGDIWSLPEIASIYHFPYEGSIVSNVVNTTSKRAPAPDILPVKESSPDDEISFFGETTYRNENKEFGIKRIDRRRHMYIVGKTGSGKSKLLELLLISDIQHDQGCCFIDPHGDSAGEILKYVPQSRIDDVVYIDPSDKDYPIGFNPLAYTTDYQSRQHLSTFFIAIFKKIFAYNWNPRMEHLIRYTTLALLETTDSNILGISRMLTDTSFRQRVIMQIQDPVIKSFWTNEYPGWNERYANDAVIPIVNKMGQFIANPVIRNMVGQTKNALDFSSFMNEGKIVIVNLSKGKLGEENTELLGSMFITKIQQAALQRAQIPEDARRDFYFYVDEFQNFATDAFSSILSEARKYHLDLTIAHQYIAQLPDDVKATAFGNVGSVIAFSVGGDDAAYLSKEFTPTFSSDDLISLNAREMYVKMSVNGKLTPPFSARTINLPSPSTDYTLEILDHSRMTYSKNRVAVENEIARWSSNESVINGDEKTSFPEPII